MNQELTYVEDMGNVTSMGEVRAMYFDGDALRLPDLTMYRFDIRGNRNYFCFPDYTDKSKDDPTFMTGVTTLTHRMIPKEEFLIKWIADKGYDAAIAYRDERAMYGTLMHTAFAKFLIDGRVDLATIDSVMENYIHHHKLWTVSVMEWAGDLKQDLIGFAQFCIDYKIKPLAIEVTLGHARERFAGTVDLVCKMTIEEKGFFGEEYKSGVNKGQPKESKQSREIFAIVDFKSGRSFKGGAHNAAQLYFYADLVEHTWGDMNIERMYNWNPKDWKKNPGYSLTDQTETYSSAQADILLQLFRLENKDPQESTRLIITGELLLHEPIEANFTVKTIQELAMERIADSDGKIDDWKYDTFESFME